ncbi:amidohydrolase family protein [Falsiphaeobacter marinintestinus]|uniref:amidohydrolase family protein n=1 Tax=Falsiphaeobacter marinintestinus TaxID=1492905 RepID=UPI0011B369A6|nr:amidohydrolase family protein [Phaeobacter marinintestinus]
MADIRITNCHIHVFTDQHAPVDFPFPAARILRKSPMLILAVASLLRLLGRENLADQVDRLYQFQQQGARGSQDAILRDVKEHCPGDTRFVVLPMEMNGAGYGDVPISLRDQHDDLARLRLHPDHLGTVLPFATVDPRVPGSVEECLRAITELGFAGLKIYPRLGFAPDHPRLMEEVYPVLAERNLPVMTHCSRGGVQGRDVDDYQADGLTRPAAYLPVLRAFPEMRICLAHFGGARDWEAYMNAKPTSGGENWMTQTREMICSGEFPNLWTDISYTLFRFADYAPILRLLLKGNLDSDKRLRRRVLFGSDFYMTRQEKLSERAVCIRLRDTLGEALFQQLAETNPAIWLGEASEVDRSLWTSLG